MTENPRISIMLVDDHPVVRAGLETIINSQPDMVVAAHAATGEEALVNAAQVPLDIVLMDLRLPGISGVEAIRKICAESPKMRVIALTTYEGDEDIHQAMLAGAVSYIIKGMPYEVLLQAIRTVHRGQSFLPHGVSEVLNERLPGDLSAREREVLDLMVKGLSNRTIAQQLGITERTVKFHVGSILAHLDVEDRTQAVVAALRRGYVHL